jgi:hypothetical protein
MKYDPTTFPGFKVKRVFHDGREIKRCVGFDPEAGVAEYIACDENGRPLIVHNLPVVNSTAPGVIMTEPPLSEILPAVAV